MKDRAARYPLGAEVRLADLAIDPYPILARLRETEPVSRVPEVGMWFVTRRDDVLTILRDPEGFTTDAPDSTIRDIFGAHMMTTEGPVQVRYKRKCMPPFQVRRLSDETAPGLEEEIDRRVGSFAGKRRAEVCTELARPVALHAVMSRLGLPLDTTAQVNEWYELFAKALANFTRDPDVRRAGKGAARDLRAALRPILDDLAASPDDSLLSDLVCDRVDPLTREEIESNALIILFGGIETTEAMIANALWALLSHPDQWKRVKEGRVRIDEAVEETLRWEPAVQSATRYATRQVALRGAVIEEGDAVQCMLGAANRDPAHFQDPDVFDVRRVNAGDHLSFAVGRHFCLGASLARLETKLVLESLLRHAPDVALDPERSSAPRGYEFRKPDTLRVIW